MITEKWLYELHGKIKGVSIFVKYSSTLRDQTIYYGLSRESKMWFTDLNQLIKFLTY